MLPQHRVRTKLGKPLGKLHTVFVAVGKALAIFCPTKEFGILDSALLKQVIDIPKEVSFGTGLSFDLDLTFVVVIGGNRQLGNAFWGHVSAAFGRNSGVGHGCYFGGTFQVPDILSDRLSGSGRVQDIHEARSDGRRMRSRVHLSRIENASEAKHSCARTVCIVIPSFASYLIIVVVDTLGIGWRSTWLDSATQFLDVGRFRDRANRIFLVVVTDDFGRRHWTVHDAADCCRLPIYRHSCTPQASNKH